MRITYGYWQDDCIIYQTISLFFASFCAFRSCSEEFSRSNENEKVLFGGAASSSVCLVTVSTISIVHSRLGAETSSTCPFFVQICLKINFSSAVGGASSFRSDPDRRMRSCRAPNSRKIASRMHLSCESSWIPFSCYRLLSID